MLQAFPTKNGTGISIFGDFRELNLLYDTIHHFGSILDENKYPEKAQHLLLMNFAYEVRKSFSGQRFTKKIKFEGDDFEHTLYGFQLVWTDILIFMNVLRFNAGFIQSDKLHQAVMYGLEYIVEQAMFDYDPEGANELKSFIGRRINIHSVYAFIIYQALHIKFISTSPGKPRFRKIPVLISGYFSEWGQFYKSLISSFKKSAKENKCEITDLEFSEFPEIVW